MKLVVDLRLINTSGIGTYLKNVFPNIIDSFDEVVVLGDKNEISKFKWSKKVKIIPFYDKIYLFSEQIKYLYKIPKCDVYWCPHFNAPLLPIRAKKMIVTIYDVNHLANPNYFSFLKRLWAMVLYINATKKSDLILTISNFSKNEIIKHLNVKENKISIVSCGVDFKLFSSLDNKGLNATLPDKYFLFVGNVKPHKNLITLLKAYNELDSSIKQVNKLVILGKKEGFITADNEIFGFIEENNLNSFVHFTGYILDEEVPFIYKRATLFIFPSLYEGFGLPILEAMACELPVLSSNRASLPEVGGKAAMYFDPLDYKGLSCIITELLKDSSLQIKMIKEGAEQVKKFTWEETIDKHLKVFKTLL